MTFAPIALFTYNRLSHTQRTLEALRLNEHAEDSDLYVFSDGPAREEERDKVGSVRAYCAGITGFNQVRCINRERNLGLAGSIISGVTEIVERHGRVIVLEDDLVTSRYFLRFMNDGLDRFAREERVISIHGYVYSLKADLPDVFFLRGADCWGWATWRRGWDLFEADGTKLLGELRARKLTYQFDFDGTYGFTRMLADQVDGKNDSWAIRWSASAFLQDKLTLYPARSLVQNIGVGKHAGGVHGGDAEAFVTVSASEPILMANVPVEESAVAREAFKAFFRTVPRPSVLQRAANKVRRIVQRIS